jgi:hypothetical protein
MRQLPDDYARCLGLVVEDPNDEDNAEWVEGCRDCLRRTSERKGVDYGPWFDPPASFAVDCPERISE